MRYGIEIEAVPREARRSSYGLLAANDDNLVEIGGDASLPYGGVELRAARPLRPCEVQPWVEGVGQLLKAQQYEASRACGLHLHFDRHSANPAHLENIVWALSAWALAARMDDVSPSLFGTSIRRLRGNYAEAPSPYILRDLATHGYEALGSHFGAVSYSSHWPTIELRAPSGTVCSARILRIWRRLRLAFLVCRTEAIKDAVRVAQDTKTPESFRLLGQAFDKAVRNAEKAYLAKAARKCAKKTPTNPAPKAQETEQLTLCV